MKIALLVLVTTPSSVSAWIPSSRTTTTTTSTARRMGYLDDLSKELYTKDDFDRPEDIDRNKLKLDEKDVDRFGVGNWQDFVDFEEFDGGDGQMGVAGDGKKGLEKEWKGAAQLAKSKTMSAKNAWGRSTGYAESLMDKGVEATRAQQLENWHNQQDVLQARKQQRFMTDEFDQVSKDENWRSLSKFGAERNQDFDLDETLGDVIPGPVLETIEMSSRINRNEVYEFDLKNSFMGFSDFRARFTPNTAEWSITPPEGSISGREATNFIVKFRPSNPGVTETYLVIDTEEDKWTYKFVGTGSM